MSVGEPHSFTRKPVNVRRVDLRCPVATHIAKAEVIGEVEVSAEDGEVPRAEILNLRDSEPVSVDQQSQAYPAVSIPSGDSFRHFLAMARQYERLEEDEERALGRLALDGDIEAQKKLVVHNLKLVIAIAEVEHDLYGMSEVDAVVSAPVGAAKSIERGDVVSFTGTLLKADSMMRNVFIHDGKLD